MVCGAALSWPSKSWASESYRISPSSSRSPITGAIFTSGASDS
jgi:hypothetical protein